MKRRSRGGTAGGTKRIRTLLCLLERALEILDLRLELLGFLHVMPLIDARGRARIFHDGAARATELLVHFSLPPYHTVPSEMVVGDRAAACEALCLLGRLALKRGEAGHRVERHVLGLATASAVAPVDDPRQVGLASRP